MGKGKTLQNEWFIYKMKKILHSAESWKQEAQSKET